MNVKFQSKYEFMSQKFLKIKFFANISKIKKILMEIKQF